MSKIEELNEQEEMDYFTAKEEEYEYAVSRSVELTTDYLTAKQMVDDATAILKQLKPEIVKLHSQGISFPRLSVTHSTRKGNVNMKKLCADLGLMDSDLDKYRGKEIEIDTIKVKS